MQSIVKEAKKAAHKTESDFSGIYDSEDIHDVASDLVLSMRLDLSGIPAMSQKKEHKEDIPLLDLYEKEEVAPSPVAAVAQHVSVISNNVDSVSS